MEKAETSAEAIFVELGKLNRADKLRAIRYLAETLVAEEVEPLVSGAVYEVWSPFDSAGTAKDLLKMLEDAQESGNG